MTETPVEEKPAERTPPSSSRGQRLWAVLLVLDSFFVITFGGTLAMKLYVHAQAPAVVTPTRHVHRPPKAAPAPAASTAPAAAPAPKPAEPAKPASKPESAKTDSAPSPRPSMLSQAPRHQSAAPQPAGSDADAAKVKALPTEFSIKAPGARSVELVGAFLVHGGRKTMVSHPDGTWTITVYLKPDTYRYWFVVNGKKKLDPNSPRVDRGASVVTVGQ